MHPQGEPLADSGFEIGKDGAGLIVVGYDGTGPSRNALAYAAGLARRDHAGLLIAFVESLTSATLWFYAGAPFVPDPAGDLAEDLREELRGLAVPWQFVAMRGDAIRALESLADASMADAIVVGRSRSMWHSVAVGLARRSRRTVLIVP
ncbi:universal stress protein [Nonomuraea typhae]|uniref:universal stress protein n=1 Tax=Nonomuraea typhae TaxID=2603600 RepID=UPI0012FC90EE|nr:universal stress protein [Nonomuraea typhae]